MADKTLTAIAPDQTIITMKTADQGDGTFALVVSAVLRTLLSGEDQTATALDPTFWNYGGGDYRVPATSALYRAGVWSDWRAVDYRGRPFWTPPTVGAYEVTAGDKAATRTLRS